MSVLFGDNNIKRVIEKDFQEQILMLAISTEANTNDL